MGRDTLSLDEVAPSPVQPGLGHFQRWGSYQISTKFKIFEKTHAEMYFLLKKLPKPSLSDKQFYYEELLDSI